MKRYKVFFAFQFDPATEAMYHTVRNDLLEDKDIRNSFDFLHGFSGRISTTLREVELDIQAFRNQNLQLYDQFRKRILSSDIIVADLTNDNPNVHVELGIALMANKNILRVSGRNAERVASDLRDFPIEQYRNADELKERIERYLKMFLSIKKLELSVNAGSSYQYQFKDDVVIENRQYIHRADLPPRTEAAVNYKEIFEMRDGEMRLKFTFRWADNEESWFGIAFRYTAAQPWTDGYLLYIRKNGQMELVGQPDWSRDANRRKQYNERAEGELSTLNMRLDGDFLKATLDNDWGNSLEVDHLQIQGYGKVALICLSSSVSVNSVETVKRDTIDPPESDVRS
jgi:hypothetical protein